MNKRDVNEQKLFNFFAGKKIATTEDSWESISNQLDKLERKKRKVLFIWFLLVGILLSGSVYLFQIFHSKPSFDTMSTNLPTTSPNSVSIDELDQGMKMERTTLNTSSITESKEVSNNEDKINTEISSGISVDSQNKLENKKRIEEIGQINNVRISKSKFTDNNNTINNEQTSINSVIKSNSQSLSINSTFREMDTFAASDVNIDPSKSDAELMPRELNIINSRQTSGKNMVETLSIFESLNRKDINLLSLEDLQITEQQLIYNSGHISNVKRIKYFVELSTGAGLPFRKIKNLNLESSDYNNIISTETPWYTFNGGLNAGLVLDEDWSISTGINCTQIISKFEYIDATATRLEAIYDPTTLELKRYELVNGEYVERGNNRIVLINIPLNLTYSKSFGAWKIGVEAGAGINYLADHSGKILYGEQDVRRLKDGPELYKKSLGANWNAALSVQRHLSKSIALTIRPQFKRYISDWSLQKNINVSYDIVDINIGIRKYF